MIGLYLKPKVLESVQILIINRAVVASAQGLRPNSIAVFLILVVVCGGDRKDKQLRPLYYIPPVASILSATLHKKRKIQK